MAVFADATSGDSSYRFRFLRPAAPAPDLTVDVDFHRALLPPCAFSDHFVCPFPAAGQHASPRDRGRVRNLSGG